MQTATNGQNPYLADVHPDYDAAQAYSNDRYLRPAANAKNWRLAFFLLLLLCAGQTYALVVVTTRQQTVPYIVEVDEAGAARAIKELTPHPPLSPLVLKAILTRWVQDMRTITTDRQASIVQTNRAYQMCLEPAQKVIAAYYHDTPPESLLAPSSRSPRTAPSSADTAPRAPEMPPRPIQSLSGQHERPQLESGFRQSALIALHPLSVA